MKPTLPTRASTLLLLAIALSPSAPAQSAPPPPATTVTATTATTAATPATDETIELSPFVVVESDNIGYAATSTLAGTRIRTDLRDLGSAITVITPEFRFLTNTFSF